MKTLQNAPTTPGSAVLAPAERPAEAASRDGSSMMDWFYGRTALYVDPGKPVRGCFYTPHSWRLMPHDGFRLSPHSASDCR